MWVHMGSNLNMPNILVEVWVGTKEYVKQLSEHIITILLTVFALWFITFVINYLFPNKPLIIHYLEIVSQSVILLLFIYYIILGPKIKQLLDKIRNVS